MKNNFAAFSNLLDCSQPGVGHATVPTARVQLARHKVMRLEKNFAVQTIRVKNGIVWVTGTPANGDLVLFPGNQIELKDNWPFVIEALEEAELALDRVI